MDRWWLCGPEGQIFAKAPLPLLLRGNPSGRRTPVSRWERGNPGWDPRPITHLITQVGPPERVLAGA